MDVYSLQELMGHADLQVLRRYLKQTNQDIRESHHRANPDPFPCWSGLS